MKTFKRLEFVNVIFKHANCIAEINGNEKKEIDLVSRTNFYKKIEELTNIGKRDFFVVISNKGIPTIVYTYESVNACKCEYNYHIYVHNKEYRIKKI